MKPTIWLEPIRTEYPLVVIFLSRQIPINTQVNR